MRWTLKEPEEGEAPKQNRKKFVSYYAYKTGVFPSPANNGKWVARVAKGNNNTPTTLSQHDTEEEAQKAYDLYYESLCEE